MAIATQFFNGRAHVQRRFFVVVLLTIYQFCKGAIVDGEVSVPANDTIFITKFCFDYASHKGGKVGFMNVTLRWPITQSSDKVSLVVYDDQARSYPGPSDKWKHYSCDERLKHAQDVVPLTSLDQVNVETMIEAHFQFQVAQSIRRRWFYLALADCSGSEFVVDFEVRMQNTLHGWQREFSSDQYGVLDLWSVFLVVYLIITMAQRKANHLLQADSASSKSLHPLITILWLGLLCATASNACYVLHYLRFANSGVGLPAFYIVAKLFSMVSKFCLITIVLLVSEGRCISRALVVGDITKKCLFLVPWLICCFALELYGEYSVSRNYTNNFVYATPFGLLVVAGDLCMLCFYVWNLRRTIRAESDSWNLFFYQTWGIAYALWFLVLPASVALSSMGSWSQYLFAAVITSSTRAALFAALVRGLWPTRESYFKLDPVVEPEAEIVGMDSFSYSLAEMDNSAVLL